VRHHAVSPARLDDTSLQADRHGHLSGVKTVAFCRISLQVLTTSLKAVRSGQPIVESHRYYFALRRISFDLGDMIICCIGSYIALSTCVLGAAFPFDVHHKSSHLLPSDHRDHPFPQLFALHRIFLWCLDLFHISCCCNVETLRAVIGHFLRLRT
jgi:hypothetical protein